ncbi:MAG: phage holin [Eubacterium sp.]|nr:phage holin [Eubacterium sp.]
MSSINWKRRLKNRNFWIGLTGALALFIQTLLSLLDISLDLGPAQELFNTLFSVLAAYGVLIDPTTPGTSDSPRVLGLEDSQAAQQPAASEKAPLTPEDIGRILKGGRL